MNKMRRRKYNSKNDDRYLPANEEERIRNKSKWSKIDRAKIEKWGRNSQLKYEYLMNQQAAKAQIDYLIRQLKIHGKNGNMYNTYDELLQQLAQARKIAWPIKEMK